MRWSRLSEDVRADALSATERSVWVIDRRAQTISRVDRAGGATRTRRWGGATAIAMPTDAVAYVGDDAERIWSAEPGSLNPRDAEIVASRLGFVHALAADQAGAGLVALVGAAGPRRVPVPRPFPPEPFRSTRLIYVDLQAGNAVSTVTRVPRSTASWPHRTDRWRTLRRSPGRCWPSRSSRA